MLTSLVRVMVPMAMWYPRVVVCQIRKSAKWYVWRKMAFVGHIYTNILDNIRPVYDLMVHLSQTGW